MFLGHLANCWQFNDSLAGVAGQAFTISSPVFEPGKFTRNGLRLRGTSALNGGPALATNLIPFAAGWTLLLWLNPVTLAFPTGSANIIKNQNALNGGFSLVLNDTGLILFSVNQDANVSLGITSANPIPAGEHALIMCGYNTQSKKTFLRVNNVESVSEVFTPFPGVPQNLEFGGVDGVVSLLALFLAQNMSPSVFGTLWNGGAGLDHPF